jgi:hypothetical protein
LLGDGVDWLALERRVLAAPRMGCWSTQHWRLTASASRSKTQQTPSARG